MSDMIDRLALRARPRGPSIMRQWWGKLLFLHWPVEAALLRPLVPAPLEIDTFDGQAWIGLVPFTMWGIRPSFAPPVPGLSAFHELNVRTYVHLNGLPGVWFFSLDAASRLAVWGARKFFHLPYFNARMELAQTGDVISYDSTRTQSNAPPAEFHARWKIGEELSPTTNGSLPFFLTERYCLYAERNGKLSRVRIFHRPWPLRDASLSALRSTMLESHGLPEPQGEPLLHYAKSIKVDIWPPHKA